MIFNLIKNSTKKKGIRKGRACLSYELLAIEVADRLA